LLRGSAIWQVCGHCDLKQTGEIHIQINENPHIVIVIIIIAIIIIFILILLLLIIIIVLLFISVSTVAVFSRRAVPGQILSVPVGAGHQVCHMVSVFAIPRHRQF
jgi:small-conductance mechanosensitive channel